MAARLFPDPVLGVLGLVVLIFSALVYIRTVQPTVPFWDCGEFIACSWTLGIPHPPGTPLFVLIGRIFSLLPIASDISHRVNLLSSFSSAATATMAFFLLARLITSWYSDRYPDPVLNLTQRLSIYSGSLAGALFVAFSNTNWSNSVEAEVYGFSMFLMMVLLWLALVWAAHRDDPAADRFLVALAFIAFLSVGVHLTVFLVMPPIFLAVVLLSERLRRDWRFWLVSVALLLVTWELSPFLWTITGLLAVVGGAAAWRRLRLIGWVWTVLVWVVGVFLAIQRNEPWPVFMAALIWGLGVLPWAVLNSRWRLPFALLLAAYLGYSVQLYTPIRAANKPSINQNDPTTWATFRGFLERKQYGSESMLHRALTRRGTWANQLGQHERMGFWGFFDQQYGFNDRAFTPIFLLGFAGLYQLARRRRVLGLLFIVLLLVTSLGLIWYMNFADGTKYNPATQDAYLEVRDRDYFFTPYFILFAMAIGMGGAALVRWLAGGSRLWPAVGAVVVVLLPLRALQANYFINDRSNNYIAYDYAYNLLMSADPNAVLFTNGDNDTFPVWCLQETYGIRRDVRVANLSLLNTNWYIKQLKNEHDVPIDLTDDEIDRLEHYRTPDNKVHRVQDQMTDVILSSNKGKYPINFAVTVSGSSRQFQEEPLDRHLVMTGMAYRLVSEEGEAMVDLDLVLDRLWHVFLFRGVNDPAVYKDFNAHRMLPNYSAGFFHAADSLRRAGRRDEAAQLMRRSLELFPDQWEPYVYLAQLYTEMNRPEALESLLVSAGGLTDQPERAFVNIGYSFSRLGNNARAEQILRTMLARWPRSESAFKTLVKIYYDTGRYDSLLSLAQTWVKDNPSDEQGRKLLEQVRALAAESTKARSDTTGTPR
jgi:tetratricopeptide (TPR) repeat protein